MKEIINKCPLFIGIKKEDIDKLLGNIFFQTKKYNPKEIISYQDEVVEHLMIVVSGTVHGVMNDISGKALIIEELNPPKPLATAFIFGNDNRFPVNIISETESTIIKIPKSEIIKMMKLNDDFLLNFVNIISGRAQFLSEKLKFLSFKNIKAKFAYYIMNLAKNENSNSIILPISQEKMADLFGVSRPALARAIREMHNEGIISAQAKQIQILNTYELYELIN